MAEPTAADKRNGCIGCAGLLVLVGLAAAFCGGGDTTERPQLAREGNMVTMRGPQICAATEEGFDQLSKWLARGDQAEAVRQLDANGGGKLLAAGDVVKVLETGFTRNKVRIVALDLECWLVREATDKPPTKGQ